MSYLERAFFWYKWHLDPYSVTEIPVVIPQKPMTYRRHNMSSLGAALTVDIDMSLLPTDRAQETVPIAAANDDNVTVAGCIFLPTLQWPLSPTPWF
jgi:hypothetical protein